jgi:hypothetical protein
LNGKIVGGETAVRCLSIGDSEGCQMHSGMALNGGVELAA